MFHKNVKKEYGTKKPTSSRQGTTYQSHSTRDDHGNDRKSRIMIMHHYYTRKSTKITHSNSGQRINPTVSLVRRKRRRHEAYILEGEIRKIKPPIINGEHKKWEYVEA